MTMLIKMVSLCIANRCFTCPLNLRLLRQLKRVIHLDTQVPHCRFQFGVPKQYLDGPQVLGAPVDQSGLRPPQRMRSRILQLWKWNGYLDRQEMAVDGLGHVSHPNYATIAFKSRRNDGSMSRI